MENEAMGNEAAQAETQGNEAAGRAPGDESGTTEIAPNDLTAHETNAAGCGGDQTQPRLPQNVQPPYTGQPRVAPAPVCIPAPMPPTAALDSPSYKALRGAVISPVFTIAAVFLALALIAELIDIATALASVAAFAGSGCVRYISQYLVPIIIIGVPLLLLLLGMFEARSSLAGEDMPPPTRGWTLIKSSMIIRLVFACAWTLVTIILAVGLFSVAGIYDATDSSGHTYSEYGGYRGYSDDCVTYDLSGLAEETPAVRQAATPRPSRAELAIYCAYGSLAALALFIMKIVYYVKAISCVNIAAGCLRPGVLNARMPIYPVVMNILLAVMTLAMIVAFAVLENSGFFYPAYSSGYFVYFSYYNIFLNAATALGLHGGWLRGGSYIGVYLATAFATLGYRARARALLAADAAQNGSD